MRTNNIYYTIEREYVVNNEAKTSTFTTNDFKRAESHYKWLRHCYNNIGDWHRTNCKMSFYMHNTSAGHSHLLALVGFNTIDSNSINFYKELYKLE